MTRTKLTTVAELEAFAKEHCPDDRPIQLTTSQARSVLRRVKWRARTKRGGGIEIWYRRKWLHLCHTDLVDDVCTWTSTHRAEDDLESCDDPRHVDFYRSRCVYGARVGSEFFAVVQTLTDG